MELDPATTPVTAGAVWNKMLLGMWKDSALPVARGIRVRNALGDYVAATPVQDIHFPFDNQTLQTLPDTFQSPAWGALQNPTSDSEPPWSTLAEILFPSCCSTERPGVRHAQLLTTGQV